MEYSVIAMYPEQIYGSPVNKRVSFNPHVHGIFSIHGVEYCKVYARLKSGIRLFLYTHVNLNPPNECARPEISPNI